MKITIKPGLIILFTGIVFCSIFLYYESLSAKNLVEENDEGGKVLGTEEAVINSDTIYTLNNLPFSREKQVFKNTEPQKIGNDDISLSAQCGVVLDNKSGIILFEKDAEKQVPIASITKLATALVFIDYNPGWDIVHEMKKEDRVEGGKIYLYQGERVKIRDLFNMSLVGSANTATMALVNSTELSLEEFVLKMNEKASYLGLGNTKFSDPVGISQYNLSTARDVALLAQIALSDEDIKNALMMEKYSFKTEAGKYKVAHSTNYLIEDSSSEIKMLGGKTGYTDLAGYCFVGMFSNTENREVISVVLGDDSLNSRFKDSKELALWSYDNYIWQ